MNSKMGLIIVCGAVDWIHLALDRVQWHAVVNTAMNFIIPYRVDSFLTQSLLVCAYTQRYTYFNKNTPINTTEVEIHALQILVQDGGHRSTPLCRTQKRSSSSFYT